LRMCLKCFPSLSTNTAPCTHHSPSEAIAAKINGVERQRTDEGSYRSGVAREGVPAAEHGGEHGVGLPLRERLDGGRVLLPPCAIANTAVISLKFEPARAEGSDGSGESRGAGKGPTDIEEDRSGGGGGGLRRLHRRRCWPCPARRFWLRLGFCPLGRVGVGEEDLRARDDEEEEERRGIWIQAERPDPQFDTSTCHAAP
jgi:hypothetical protein